MVIVSGMGAVAVVTLNTLTVLVYLKERSLRKRSMYLVINLVVVDMFLGGFGIAEVWRLGKDCNFWRTNFLSSSVTTYGYLLIPLASVTNLAAISLERMHATFRPFNHPLIKKKMFGAAIAAVWITPGISSAINSFIDFTFDLNSSFLLFFLLIVLVSYSSIAVKIVCGNQAHNHSATSRERKLTKTLLIVTVASLLLTLPVIIYSIYCSVSSHSSCRISFRVDMYFKRLFGANSLVNPVFYAFRVPEFRRALFSFLRCRFQPQTDQVFPL